MVSERFVWRKSIEHGTVGSKTGYCGEGIIDTQQNRFGPSIAERFVEQFNKNPKKAESWGWLEEGSFTMPEDLKRTPSKAHEFTPSDIQPDIVVKIIEPDGSYAFGHLEAVVSIAGGGQGYKLVGGETVRLKEGSTIERWDFS